MKLVYKILEDALCDCSCMHQHTVEEMAVLRTGCGASSESSVTLGKSAVMTSGFYPGTESVSAT